MKKYHLCRVYHPYLSEAWAIAQPYTARYLNKKGEWDNSGNSKSFFDRRDAEKFAELHLNQNKVCFI